MILAALAFALIAPGPGNAMKALGLSTPLTCLVFFLQGLSIELKDFLKGGRLVSVFVWGFLLACLLAPLFGWACSAAFGMKDDDLVGFLLMCTMTPTIASGVVIAGRAGGEKTTAIALTVVLVFVGMLVIPFSLKLLLSRTVAVPQADLLRQLVFTVLVPTVVGQGMRLLFPKIMQNPAFRRIDKDAPSVLIGLLVYLSLAPQAGKLAGISLVKLLVLAAAAFLVHSSLLAGGYVVSRRVLAIDRPKSLALTFVCSQKSLALGAPIWGNLFAAAYPLAILPLVVFHAFQIFLDGFLATRAARTQA